MAVRHLFDTRLGDTSLNVPSPLSAGAIPTLLGIATLTSATDPTVTFDSAHGYTVGSVVFNSTAGALRTWTCRDATPGAAKWIFEGADFTNGGTNPNFEVTQFGLGAALMAEEGNINRQISSAGVNPGATGVDSVLAIYTLPAGSFDLSGRGINIAAMGSFTSAATAKLIKLIYNPTTAVVGSTVSGGTTIASFTDSTANSAGGWQLAANIFKYGVAGSNTQLALHETAQSGSIVGALTAPTLLTATESSAILLAITGNAAVVGNITFNFLEVNALN